MDGEFAELVDLAKALRQRVDAFQADFGEVTAPLKRIRADLEAIDADMEQLAELDCHRQINF